MATIAGYAALYGELSENTGGPYVFKEKIAVGAFASAVAANRQDIKALLNHDSKPVSSRTLFFMSTLRWEKRTSAAHGSTSQEPRSTAY